MAGSTFQENEELRCDRGINQARCAEFDPWKASRQAPMRPELIALKRFLFCDTNILQLTDEHQALAIAQISPCTAPYNRPNTDCLSAKIFPMTRDTDAYTTP
jgi:hypothetical protein